MSRLTLTPRWRGPQTKRAERLRIETTSRLCRELGREKPVIKLPKDKQ